MEKVCSRCKENKSIENFGKRVNSRDGYFGTCKKCRNLDCKKWKEKKVYTTEEIDLRKQKGKDYYEMNKEYILKRCSVYRNINKDSIKKYKKKYYSNNREKLIDYSSQYHLNRLKSDEFYKFKANIKNLIKNTLKNKGFRKNTKSEKILGISITEFVEYIESKFEPWMNWNNYGNFDGKMGQDFNHSWSIDHIIPIHTAKNEEEVILLNHYTNLQPLCSRVNMFIKGSKLDF